MVSFRISDPSETDFLMEDAPTPIIPFTPPASPAAQPPPRTPAPSPTPPRHRDSPLPVRASPTLSSASSSASSSIVKRPVPVPPAPKSGARNPSNYVWGEHAPIAKISPYGEPIWDAASAGPNQARGGVYHAPKDAWGGRASVSPPEAPTMEELELDEELLQFSALQDRLDAESDGNRNDTPPPYTPDSLPPLETVKEEPSEEPAPSPLPSGPPSPCSSLGAEKRKREDSDSDPDLASSSPSLSPASSEAYPPLRGFKRTVSPSGESGDGKRREVVYKSLSYLRKFAPVQQREQRDLARLREEALSAREDRLLGELVVAKPSFLLIIYRASRSTTPTSVRQYMVQNSLPLGEVLVVQRRVNILFATREDFDFAAAHSYLFGIVYSPLGYIPTSPRAKYWYRLIFSISVVGKYDIEEQVVAFFEQIGVLVASVDPCKDPAFVKVYLLTVEDWARAACWTEDNGMIIIPGEKYGRPCALSPIRSLAATDDEEVVKLFVGNLPQGASEETIRGIFVSVAFTRGFHPTDVYFFGLKHSPTTNKPERYGYLFARRGLAASLISRPFGQSGMRLVIKRAANEAAEK